MFGWFRKAQPQPAPSVVTKAATGGGGMLASGPSGGPGPQRVNLTSAREQLAHFRGWQYVAIKAIATRVAGCELRIDQVGEMGPGGIKAIGVILDAPGSHPLLDAINDPNPRMVRWSLLYVTVASLQLTGRAYWWLDDSSGRLQIFPLPPHWVAPEGGYWRVRPPGNPEGFPVHTDDMAFFGLPDPADPLGGTVSPLGTQAPAVNADEAIQTAQHKAFSNGVHPGVVITAGRLPDTPGGGPGERPILTAEQRKQLISAIKAAYRGVVDYGEPIIVDGLIEAVEKFSLTPEEMDFLESGKATKNRIFQAFGVNPLIVGEIEGANRAQALVAEESFCSNVINPVLTLLSQTLTAWVASRYGPRWSVWFVPCKPHDADDEFRYFQLGYSGGAITHNELRAKIGLPEVPWGNETRSGSSQSALPEVKRLLGGLDPYTMCDLADHDEPDDDLTDRQFRWLGNPRTVIDD